jgi:hypothetical protein
MEYVIVVCTILATLAQLASVIIDLAEYRNQPKLEAVQRKVVQEEAEPNSGQESHQKKVIQEETETGEDILG